MSNVELNLRAGEIVALEGRNGAGKSTRLAALAGLVPKLAGWVVGEGGLVFQNPGQQFARSNVRDELSHGLPAGATQLVEGMLQRFNLTHLAERSPHQLSGGQQRRLSLAAMLVHDHGCLLADEPTFGLDRLAAIEALQAMVDADAVPKLAVVLFSTHDPRSLASYAQRVLVLGQGGLLAETDPRSFLLDPELLETAGLRPSAALTRLAVEAGSAAELRAKLGTLDAAVLAAPRALVR